MAHRQTSLGCSHMCTQRALTCADSASPALWGHLPDQTPRPWLLCVCPAGLVPPSPRPWKADIAWGVWRLDNGSNLYAPYCRCCLSSKRTCPPQGPPAPCGGHLQGCCGEERQKHVDLCTHCTPTLCAHPGEDTGARQTQGPDSGGIVWSCCGFPSGQAEGDMGQNPQSWHWEDCHAPPQ